MSCSDDQNGGLAVGEPVLGGTEPLHCAGTANQEHLSDRQCDYGMLILWSSYVVVVHNNMLQHGMDFGESGTTKNLITHECAGRPGSDFRNLPEQHRTPCGQVDELGSAHCLPSGSKTPIASHRFRRIHKSVSLLQDGALLANESRHDLYAS